MLLILVMLPSCATVFGQKRTATVAMQKSEAESLIRECEQKKGKARLKCTLELGEEFVLVYNAEPKVIDRRVVESSGDWQTVLYVIQAGSIHFNIFVKENNETFWDSVRDHAITFLFGLAAGALLAFL